jgi:hypothetical protein
VAIVRCACSDVALVQRQKKQVGARALAGNELWIDGYNVLTSIEAALSDGVILHARDGCYRDLASMHGSYRKVQETLPAIRLLGEVLAECKVTSCRWLLDQPVSNSGRLKTILGQIARQQGWNWQAELVPNPDDLLCRTDQIAASSDSQILDRTSSWFNLTRLAIDSRIDDAWIVDLSGQDRN